MWFMAYKNINIYIYVSFDMICWIVGTTEFPPCVFSPFPFWARIKHTTLIFNKHVYRSFDLIRRIFLIFKNDLYNTLRAVVAFNKHERNVAKKYIKVERKNSKKLTKAFIICICFIFLRFAFQIVLLNSHRLVLQ